MNHRLKLWAVLLSFTPLTFAKADSTACIFDWAETAAPSLISSSVETQNIPYGDFTLRYYDKTQNALIVNEKTKELLFYDVSSYIRGEKELEIYAEDKTSNLKLRLRQYIVKSEEIGSSIGLTVDGTFVKNFSVTTTLDNNKSIPYWSDFVEVEIPILHSSPVTNLTFETDNEAPFEFDRVQFANEIAIPGEDNYRNIGGEIRPYWLNSASQTDFEIEVGQDLKNIGGRAYWALVSNCTEVKKAIPIEATSYLEAHSELKKPIKLPNLKGKGWQPQSWELADFLQNGSQTLVAGTLAKSVFDLSYHDEDKIGEIYFFTRESDEDTWVDISDLLLSDNTGCVIPRKTIVSDFNNDRRPDVVFICHGLDFALEVLTEKGLEKGEASRILLSKADGTYENKVLKHDGKYENCFCHGGAAGDIDNDGNIDILLSDTNYNDPAYDEPKRWEKNVGRVHILMGDGKGNFKLRDDLPETFSSSCCYYSSDLYDFNGDGYLDIWASGGAPHGSYNERNIIAYSREGKFFEEDIVDLPSDGKHTFSQDMIVENGYIYLIGINIDFSKQNYYFGEAITKVPLDASGYEVIYQHEDYHSDSCDPNGWDVSAIPWVLVSNGHLVPKQDCEGFNFKVPL